MLSSSGKAIIAPMPRKTARRGMAFFEMNICYLRATPGAGGPLRDSSPRMTPMLNGVLVTIPEMIADHR
jgi:hypothetical protein